MSPPRGGVERDSDAQDPFARGVKTQQDRAGCVLLSACFAVAVRPLHECSFPPCSGTWHREALLPRQVWNASPALYLQDPISPLSPQPALVVVSNGSGLYPSARPPCSELAFVIRGPYDLSQVLDSVS